jgi:eukaryotic-like serine/threonine-protein kinase
MSEQDRDTERSSDSGEATLPSGPVVPRALGKAPAKKSLRHELRTPLNQIIGYSEMLQEDAEDQGLADFAADLKKIERAGRRLLELVDELTSKAEAPTCIPNAPAMTAAIRESRPPGETPPPPPQNGRDRKAFIASLSTGAGSILVVDDNEANRDILARRLKNCGYVVDTAAGGREALEAVEQRRFDLLLLDVMMPEISGFEVLEKLRETRSVADLPVIMATALDASEDVVKALKLGANDYVTKPLDFAVVLARVSTQLSLKRAKDQVVELNKSLEEAQCRISKLVESSAEAMNDVRSWSTAVAVEVAIAIGADDIAVWVFEDERADAFTMTHALAPNFSEVRTIARSGQFLERDDETVIPVTGLSGDVHGALVVRGLHVGELASKVLASFAHQLGGALELQKMRRELKSAAERKRASRADMIARGVDLLRICPSCRRCFDQETTRCSHDAVLLPDPTSLPYRIAGRHRLLRILGEGGMGTVYAARDERLQRDVAVKIIKSEHFNNDTVRLRFEHEARAVARIDHPGVVAVFDSGELEDQSLFIVMELMHGRDLSDLVKCCGRGTPKQVAQLLRQGAAALAAAHRVRLVHRDIKPENIFLVAEPGGFRAKILDFGVAKELATDSGLTQTGTLIGTPLFMSPEQILGKSTDIRSDVYSFAAVAYLALSGRRVTLGETLPEILLDVVQNDPPPLSSLVHDLPKCVDEAFVAALSKDPDGRPSDVEAWVRGFADVLEQVPSESRGWITGDGMLDVESRDNGRLTTIRGAVENG